MPSRSLSCNQPVFGRHCRKKQHNWNRDTVNNASGLLMAIEKLSFLITLVAVQNVMSYIKSLTKLLQKHSLDLVQGMASVQGVQNQLSEIREDIASGTVCGIPWLRQ